MADYPRDLSAEEAGHDQSDLSDTEGPNTVELVQPWKAFHPEPKAKPVDPCLSGAVRCLFEQCPIGGGGG